MNISFDAALLSNFDEAQSREWLETNGLGGWASSTLTGAHTRRYHGLLVAAVKPPAERVLLLSKLEETLVTPTRRIELSCNQYRGAVHPRGFQYLKGFSQDLCPSFTYDDRDFSLRKTIVAIAGQNTTLIEYEFVKAPPSCTLELVPLATARSYHHLVRRRGDYTETATFRNGALTLQLLPEMPRCFISVPQSDFSPAPTWYYNFQYLEEQRRGYDFEEDLFSPGIFRVPVKTGTKFVVIISTEQHAVQDGATLLQTELARRQAVVSGLAEPDPLLKRLHLAAEQFVVRRAEHLKTIIAGYHWFTDWGRDTMISLPGLCLVPGRFDEAKQILLAFSACLNKGILPNNFDEQGRPANFNTIDATLWYFVAVYKYYQYTGDTELVTQLLPVLHEIIEQHVRGTHYGIHVEDDGLLSGGNPTIQLTWMDAKIGDWVVTPRQGKAVEVNALWFNALNIMAVLCTRLEKGTEAATYAARARVAQQRFNEIFWYGEGEYLFDYIDGAYRDTKLRPNQLMALSLPFKLVDDERGNKILRNVERRLLTPFGLRTLSPDHPAYQREYAGTQATRDAAYHQGTVWAWLLGPFISALVRYQGAAGRDKARQIVQRFSSHFSDAGIGSVSEIFDAEPPHKPRGAIAQAWSAGEILRAYAEDVLGSTPSRAA